MNFHLIYILILICALNWTIDAKPFLDLLFDKQQFHSNHYHQHHGQAARPQEPIGGKERYRQICNVIHGISECY